MLKYSLLSLLVLSLLISLTSCNQSEPQAQQSTLNDAPEFLLIADEDPLNIEQDDAFIIDGAGPLYFWVLDLTDEQKEQIKEIVSEFRSDFVGLCGRWNSGLSWEEIKEERQALREKIREAIYEILTDEQKTILDEIKTQLENGQYPDILVEKRVAFLTEQLDLMTEQQNQVTELYKEYGNLLIESRNESGDRFEFRMAKRELFMELDGKIKVLLTGEQLENGQYPDILVEKRVAFLTEQLDLMTEQQNQVTELYKEYGNLLIESRNESGDRFEFRMAKRELFMELDGKIKALLTGEQLELYEELKFQHRKRRFHHFRHSQSGQLSPL